jgi:hypothetical protein
MVGPFLLEGVGMRFIVTFEAGAWNFVIESLEGADPYHEEFAILDINEAKDAAWDLIEEIAIDPLDDSQFDLLGDGEE